MAKITNCEICGREMTSGFFTGENEYLDTGAEMLNCCPDCCAKYRISDKKERTRFAVKLENYKKANKIRKLSNAELAQLYLKYFREMQAYQQERADIRLPNFLGFYRSNEEGWFFMQEANPKDISLDRQIYKAADRQGDPALCAFRGDEISLLEYRLVNSVLVTGSLFRFTGIYEVRLNDPREMTYKPCVTYVVSTGKAFFPFNQKKKAEMAVQAVLRLLKKETGTNAVIRKFK